MKSLILCLLPICCLAQKPNFASPSPYFKSFKYTLDEGEEIRRMEYNYFTSRQRGAANPKERRVRTFFAETGQLVRIEHYRTRKMEVQIGQFLEFYDDGLPRVEGQFNSGFPTGTWKIYSRDDYIEIGEIDSLGAQGVWKAFDSDSTCLCSYRSQNNQIIEYGLNTETPSRVSSMKNKYLNREKCVLMSYERMPYLGEFEDSDTLSRMALTAKNIFNQIYDDFVIPELMVTKGVSGLTLVKFTFYENEPKPRIDIISGLSERLSSPLLGALQKIDTWELNLPWEEGTEVSYYLRIPISPSLYKYKRNTSIISPLDNTKSW